MKKIKYLLTFLITVLLLPNIVSAKENIYFKPYKVGDEIIVTLDKDGKIKGKFIVIEATPEGEKKDVEEFKKGNEIYEYVTAIYNGTILESQFTSGKTVDYTKSLVRSNLVIKTTDSGWINYENIRLLTLKDLEKLGMKDNKVSLAWLLTNTPYWLGENMQGEKAYTVDKDGNVLLVSGTSKAQIRPVIKIHKGFVDGAMICNCDDCTTNERFCPNDSTISIQSCIDSGKSESLCIVTLCEKEEIKEEEKVDKVCPNDSKINIQKCIDEGKSEEECIKKLCPNTEIIENPKTGNYLPFGLSLITVVVGFLYIITRKKTYFSK